MGPATLDILSSLLAYWAAQAGFNSQPERYEHVPPQGWEGVHHESFCLMGSPEAPPRFNPWTYVLLFFYVESNLVHLPTRLTLQILIIHFLLWIPGPRQIEYAGFRFRQM